MEGLRAEHRVDGLRSQTGGLGATRDPRDVIVRSGGAPHPVSRLNGDDAHAAIGDKPCGDTGAGADVGDGEISRRAEALQDQVDRCGWIARPVSDIVRRAIAEPPNRVEALGLRHRFS